MFKKIIYFSVAVFMIIFLWTVNSGMKTMGKSIKKEIYINSSSSNGIIGSGNSLTVFKKGESYFIEEKDLSKILNYYNAKIKVVEELENGTSYYAYSKDIKYTTKVNGEIINLHIFIGKEKTILGFPLIFGSF